MAATKPGAEGARKISPQKIAPNVVPVAAKDFFVQTRSDKRPRRFGFGWSELLGTGVAAVLAIAIFTLYNYYSAQQLLHWITPSWDLAIFTQMAQEYASFRLPIVPIKGPDFNLWGDHFHPILMLLGPVYKLFPSPLTLLVVQNALVGLSVYLIMRFAHRAIPGWNGHIVGVLLGLGFGLSYGVQQAVEAQFHEVAFALPFLCLSLGYVVLASLAEPAQKASLLTRACWWATPLPFVKEDMGITAAVIGLVVLVRSGWLRTAVNILFPIAGSAESNVRFIKRFRPVAGSWARTRGAAEGGLLMLWGCFWSFAAVTIILPLYNQNHRFDYADNVNILDAMSDPLGSIIQFFVPDEKAWSIFLLLVCGAFLWAMSPLAAVTLPTLAWRMLSTKDSYWVSTWHYSLVLMPVVFLALLDVLARHERTKRARVRAHETGRKTKTASVERVVTALVVKTPVWLIPAIAVIISLYTIVSPQSEQPLAKLGDASFTSSHPALEDIAKKQAVSAIPEGASVATDLSIITWIVPNHTVYWIGHEGKPAPDYVVISREGTSWGGKPPADTAKYATERYGHRYQQAHRFGAIEIAQRID